nr:Tex family protein [Planctomyces sp. SH-PL14]
MYDCFDRNLVVSQIAESVKVRPAQTLAVVDLLEAGNTLPFIARYRKEATQGLDEIALRAIADALESARELADRKSTVLKTIDSLGLLTPGLRQQIETCGDKVALEELYRPFKPKRKTRAATARERGLQPLADILLRQQTLRRSRSEVLRPFVDPAKEVPNEEAAVQGASDIVAETWAEEAETRQWLLHQARQFGQIFARVKRGKQAEAQKFDTYFDYKETVRRIVSHRLLAMKRGEEEGFLNVGLQLDEESTLRQLSARLIRNPQFEFHRDLVAAVSDCYSRLLLPAAESAVMQQLKERADVEAIQVFGDNLRKLLLAPPAGPHVTMGIDPGFRTGCKVAVVDGTGKFLFNTTIYPTPPRSDVDGAAKTLLDLIARFDIDLIAIGNGTASRETDAFVADVLKSPRLKNARPITKAMVSESGASIYSASELAGQEYPDLDVTVRGAISIAHRLQDPLAELVKVDPKSIGVGQYQHDVNQAALKKCLEREVQSCVNSVGVDVNLASPSLLSHVAGIGPSLSQKIVEYRDAHGPFARRQDLLQVPKLGRKAFQQAAGFLRVRDGLEPLDNSAVHPESYSVVRKMAAKLQVDVKQMLGNTQLSSRIRPEDFTDDTIGLPTVIDIIEELSRPGRDPRKAFRAVQFADDVHALEDLKPGMILEGVVTNVTHFGAFVGLGVHQDGLIHISQLSTEFVQSPSDVVSVGEIVRVRVVEVDKERRRIALSKRDVTG